MAFLRLSEEADDDEADDQDEADEAKETARRRLGAVGTHDELEPRHNDSDVVETYSMAVRLPELYRNELGHG